MPFVGFRLTIEGEEVAATDKSAGELAGHSRPAGGRWYACAGGASVSCPNNIA
jgi:hypothetical protein